MYHHFSDGWGTRKPNPNLKKKKLQTRPELNPKNCNKKGKGGSIFWKKVMIKSPKPEPVIPTQTQRNISKPNLKPKNISKPEPNLTQTQHLSTRPITTPF